MAELTTTEAARRLGVSSSTISAWCREGRIQARKVKGRWRIPEEEELAKVEARLRQQTSLAPEPPRDCRRLKFLRGWDYGDSRQVLSRGEGTDGADGARARA